MPRVAFFGPSGTFTEMALEQFVAREHAGDLDLAGHTVAGAERWAAVSPIEALAAVASGEADIACVPIESSVEGAVTPTVDALATGPQLQILAETSLSISFALAARGGVALEQARTVAAYPVAAAQVRASLGRLAPAATVMPASSNAGAAQDVSRGTADIAVTTPLAAERYGLQVVAENVADVADALTRFVLVGRPGPLPAPTGHDCTSIVIDIHNVPGSLTLAMAEFAIRGIDLTRMESRPKRTERGAYLFHFDAVGHLDDPAVAQALAALKLACRDVRFVGSWRRTAAQGSAPRSPQVGADWVAKIREGER